MTNTPPPPMDPPPEPSSPLGATGARPSVPPSTPAAQAATPSMQPSATAPAPAPATAPAAASAIPTGAPQDSGGGAAMINSIRTEVSKVIVGQQGVLAGFLAALLADGHVLLEGVPGVAKTLLVKTVASTLTVDMNRIQFTPDLMPSDITGQLMYEQASGEFAFRQGPIFTNLLLADEINRTPPKTQAALLEVMEERQTTVAGEARALPDPFMVIATQNPVEYEGTYPLPEAQLDRFLAKIYVLSLIHI